ncbi:MAG: hypothetical protein FGM24_01385 [Candidatus Kapabacteria bacterium]|nr:hypothetical protein [Candidatus Kapabacteria bacterium]
MYIPFDYDGKEPLEYVNDNGRVDGCHAIGFPFQLQRGLDTIACWRNTMNVALTADIDDDGYKDLICDIGGGGYTARVIRGGPNAGRGCQRLLQVPKVMNRDQSNTTEAFWRSASGMWRLLQYEKDSMALSPWLVLYEMRTTKTPEGTSFSFVKTDSLYGNGIHIGDMPIGDAAVVTDTATDTDWLLVMRRLNDGPRTWVLDRFDATAGRFTPTGERVTGTDFFEPWIVGHALGTKKPAVAFHVPKIGRVFCYADDLTHPFARWSPQGALEPPVSGMIAINDQSGDGLPDLVAAGGVINCGIAIYTLDSTLTTATADTLVGSTSTVRLEGSTLVATTPTRSTFSVRMVTIDGQSYDVIARHVIQPGEQRIDLTAQLQALPIGVYLLHVQVGEDAHVLRYLR